MTESQDPTRETSLDAVERALGHRFRDRRLLVRALTHSSFANDDPDAEDNETLEFLGDSVLNYLVSEMLFDAFPLEAEGTLSKARSVLVSENHFAYLARRLDLGSALRLSPGEERAGGAQPRRAARGRVRGRLRGARARRRPRRGPVLRAEDLRGGHRGARPRRPPPPRPEDRAPGARAGRGARRLPLYRLVEESGPPHDRRFVYEVAYGESERATGEGSSKKEAQTAAAEAMLNEGGIA